MPKLSVCMITYNQEAYISLAIESVLMQRAGFDVELVIGEDCSTDRTREIVDDYAGEHPDVIRVLPSEKNLGGFANLVRTLAACQGEYIALLEGDDFWTAPDKLQKQVDFLDKHPDYALCFHNALVLYQDGSRDSHPYHSKPVQETSTIEDLLGSRNFIPTCTVIFRRDCFDGFPEWAKTLRITDWLLHVLVSRHGKIRYMDEVMASYRIHPGGLWSRLNTYDILQINVDFYQKVGKHLGQPYEGIVQGQIDRCWDHLAYLIVEDCLARNQQQPQPVSEEEIFAPLNSGVQPPAGWKKQVLARLYPKMFFEGFEQKDYLKTRYYLSRAVRSDPAWLKNRGVWSIGIRTLWKSIWA